MTSILKWPCIVTVFTLVTANICAAETDICYQTPEVPESAFSQVPKITSVGPYEGLMNRCRSSISKLESALNLAHIQAGTQGNGPAVRTLERALHEAVNDVNNDGNGFLPNTTTAIIEGSMMFDRVTRGLHAARISGSTAADVKWVLANNIYELIERVYYQIDKPYYLNSIRSCFENCRDEDFDFDGEYLKKVAEVARNFLTLEEIVAHYLADDQVEEVATLSAVDSAKNILLKSVLRRDFACAISELDNLEQLVSQAICSGPITGQSNTDIQLIRDRLHEIHIPDLSCRNFHWPRRHHHHDQDQDSDSDGDDDTQSAGARSR